MSHAREQLSPNSDSRTRFVICWANAIQQSGMEAAMKSIHVVPWFSEDAGGLAHAVPGICQALYDAGTDVSLHVLQSECNDRPEFTFPVHVHARRIFPWKLGISPSMRRDIMTESANAEIIHNHGLWTMPNVYPSAISKKHSDCRLISSPHGSLAPWALSRSRWKKRLMWLTMQRQVIRDAACLHATSETEYLDLRKLALRNPIAVIPLGVAIPALGNQRNSPRRRRLLSISRLHPVKGLDNLIRAWSQIQNQAPEWDLHILGPDENNYRAELLKLSRELNAERVTLGNAIYGKEKTNAFFDADVFVLPSHTENFGLAAAEALAHGIPVIASKGAPWRELESRRCGWWIDCSPAPLAAGLSSVLKLSPETLCGFGMRGREWMTETFSWSKFAKLMLETYGWVRGNGVRPDHIRLD